MRMDLPLDKKLWKIRTEPRSRRAAGPPGRGGPWAVGRGPRAAGPSDLRAAGPWRAVGRGPPGRGPAFSKTHFLTADKPEGYNLHPFYMQPSKLELTRILLIFLRKTVFQP